jgi:hypothetical protein
VVLLRCCCIFSRVCYKMAEADEDVSMNIDDIDDVDDAPSGEQHPPSDCSHLRSATPTQRVLTYHLTSSALRSLFLQLLTFFALLPCNCQGSFLRQKSFLMDNFQNPKPISL